MPGEEPRRELGIAVQEIVAGVRRHVGPEVRIIREPLIADSAGLDRTTWVRGVVSIVCAHVGPEGVRVGDELGPGKRFQHSVEAFETAVEDSVTGSLRYVPEVDLNGYVQVRGERIHTLHLGSIALDLILDLAEPESAALNRFGQQGGGFGPRQLGADEPNEPARMHFSQRP